MSARTNVDVSSDPKMSAQHTADIQPYGSTDIDNSISPDIPSSSGLDDDSFLVTDDNTGLRSPSLGADIECLPSDVDIRRSPSNAPETSGIIQDTGNPTLPLINFGTIPDLTLCPTLGPIQPMVRSKLWSQISDPHRESATPERIYHRKSIQTLGDTDYRIGSRSELVGENSSSPLSGSSRLKTGRRRRTSTLPGLDTSPPLPLPYESARGSKQARTGLRDITSSVNRPRPQDPSRSSRRRSPFQNSSPSKYKTPHRTSVRRSVLPSTSPGHRIISRLSPDGMASALEEFQAFSKFIEAKQIISSDRSIPYIERPQ